MLSHLAPVVHLEVCAVSTATCRALLSEVIVAQHGHLPVGRQA